MIDNSKEWICCAAYKTIQDPPHLIDLEKRGFEVKNAYHEPHRQSYQPSPALHTPLQMPLQRWYLIQRWAVR